MTQHFLRSTVSVAQWCKKCKKETQHQVNDARKGAYLECIARLEKQHNEVKPADPEKQQELFP